MILTYKVYTISFNIVKKSAGVLVVMLLSASVALASTNTTTGESKNPETEKNAKKNEKVTKVVELNQLPTTTEEEKTKTSPRIAIPTSSYFNKEYLDQEGESSQDEVIGFNFINYMYKHFKFAEDIF